MTGREGRKSQIFVLNSQVSFPPRGVQGSVENDRYSAGAADLQAPGRDAPKLPGQRGRCSGAGGQGAPGLRCHAVVPPHPTPPLRIRLQTGPRGLSRYPDRSRILLRDDPLLQYLFPCPEPSEGPLEALQSQQGLARFADDLADTPLPCLRQSSALTPRPSLHLQQVLA